MGLSKGGLKGEAFQREQKRERVSKGCQGEGGFPKGTLTGEDFRKRQRRGRVSKEGKEGGELLKGARKVGGEVGEVFSRKDK